MSDKKKTDKSFDADEHFKSIQRKLQEQPGSPIRRGDVIVSVNGVPLDGHEVKEVNKDAYILLYDTDARKVVPVVVIRNGKEETLQAPIGDVLRCWLSGPKRHCPTYEEAIRRHKDWLKCGGGKVSDDLVQLQEGRGISHDPIETALDKGYLPLKDLAYILADEVHEEDFKRRWREVRSLMGNLFAKPPLPLDSFTYRFLIWGCILEKACQGVQDDNILPLYKKSKGSAELVSFGFNSQIDSALLKLADVKEYFRNHNLPLPESLFPKEKREEVGVREKSEEQPQPAGEAEETLEDRKNPNEHKEPERKPPSSSKPISGWKDIAAFLGKSVRRVKDYYRLMGLPVLKQDQGGVYAYPEKLNEWRDSHSKNRGPKSLPK
ncbi:MAG: hypothetical protein CVU57_20290 [Deltaproteobacteria bacterium HGW-Deltaproteobacteria-15]|jgi:hypothetical protein|nr:MAG: hypothetical protein CVU57_20290 [Deltaproteobacteria bacterium HGW-Deltaproteobacteria-15]